MCSNNDNSVTDLNGILTTGMRIWPLRLRQPTRRFCGDSGLQEEYLSPGILREWRIQGFCVAVQYMIKSFHIASDTVLCGTDILQDIISGDVLGINNASDIKRINDIIEFQTVDLGNQFGIGDTFGKGQGKHSPHPDW